MTGPRKRCGVCTQWLRHEIPSLGDDDEVTPLVYRCPHGHEVWAYDLAEARWRRVAGHGGYAGYHAARVSAGCE